MHAIFFYMNGTKGYHVKLSQKERGRCKMNSLICGIQKNKNNNKSVRGTKQENFPTELSLSDRAVREW